MAQPKTVAGVLLWIYAGVRTLMDLLGGIDFVIERSGDPSWLADVFYFLINPPPWFLLIAIAIGLVLVFWPRQTTKRAGDQMSAPVIGMVLFGSAFVICLVWWVATQTSTTLDVAKQTPAAGTAETAPQMLTERWDADKLAVVKKIYRALQDEMLPHYDKWGDKIAGPWQSIILETGRDGYVERANAFLREPATGLHNLQAVLEKNAIYSDVLAEFDGAPEKHNETVAAQRNFIDRVQRLPQEPSKANLGLIEAEGQAFQQAVGSYGQWIRDRIKIAADLYRRGERQVASGTASPLSNEPASPGIVASEATEYDYALTVKRVDAEDRRRLEKEGGPVAERTIRFILRLENHIATPIRYEVAKLSINGRERTEILARGSVIPQHGTASFYTPTISVPHDELGRVFKATIDVEIKYGSPNEYLRQIHKITRVDVYPMSGRTTSLDVKNEDTPIMASENGQ